MKLNVNRSSQAKILVNNTGWIYFGKMVTQLLSVIVSVLVLKKLAVDIFGTYNILMKVLIIFNLIAVSPIVSVLNRYIPELVKNQEINKLKRLISLSLILTTAGVIVLLILLYFQGTLFFDFINVENYEIYLKALFVYLFFSFAKRFANTVITSLLLHKFGTILNIFSSVVRSVLLIIVLKQLDVNLFLNIEAIATICFSIPSIFMLVPYMLKLKSGEPEFDYEPVTKRRVIKYGIFSSANELGAGIVSKTSDYYIIAAMSDAYYVGLYSFANKIFEIFYKILPAREFLTVLRPVFFQRFTGNYNQENFTQIYNFIVKIMLPVFSLPTIYFAIFGNEIIHFINPEYSGVYWVTLTVLMSNVTTAFFMPLSLVMQLKERMDIGLLSKIIIVFSIVVGIYSMKHYGILGVSVTTLLAQLIKEFFCLYMLKKDVRIVYRLKELINYIIVFSIVGVSFYFIKVMCFNLMMFGIISVLFFIAIFAGIIIFHPFTDADLVLIDKLGQSSRLTRKIVPVIKKIYSLKTIFKKSKKNQ